MKSILLIVIAILLSTAAYPQNKIQGEKKSRNQVYYERLQYVNKYNRMMDSLKSDNAVYNSFKKFPKSTQDSLRKYRDYSKGNLKRLFKYLDRPRARML